MGTELTLVVGTNGESNQVPNVVGKTLREAKSLLWGAGFNIGTLEYDAEMSLLDRTDAVVATQSPAAQTRASNGRAVSLTLTYGL